MTGEPFSPEQHDRIERALTAAEEQSGLRFWVRVGTLGSDPRMDAESTLANLATSGRQGAVLVLVGPEERKLEVMTSPGAKRRISDQAAGFAVLTMTSSFAVGDLVGGIVNGLRQLADSAGRDPKGTQGQVTTGEPARRAEQPADGEGEALQHGPREVPGSQSAPGEVSAGR